MPFNFEFKHNENDLRILCLNIRSLNSNFEELLAFIGQATKPFDIISLNETFLNSNSNNFYEIPTYAHLTLNRKNGHGGGIRIYYKDHLTVSIKQDLTGEFDTHESIFANVSYSNKSIMFGSIYRAPSKSIENFNAYLSNILFNNQSILDKSCIITGDLNIDYLLCNERESHRNFKEIMNENGFSMQVRDKTRCSDQSGLPVSMLDHIFTNFTNNNYTSVISDKITKSDHLAIIFSCKFCTPKIKIRKMFYDFSYNNCIKFQENAASLYENYAINSNDIDRETDLFIKFNNDLVKRYFPLKVKYISIKRLEMKWINKSILKLIDKKHKLYILYKKNELPSHVYKAYADLLAILLKSLRRDYYKSKLQETRDSHKTWSVINEILGRNRKYNKIKEIVFQGEKITDEVEISSRFCEHFSSVPIVTQNNLNASLNQYDELIPYNATSFTFNQITPIEIQKIIKSLHKKGRNLPSKFLKIANQYIAPILSSLFNMCLDQGYYPQAFKIARVTPIHKNGDIRDIKNYRPISTLLNLNKILEKLLYYRLNTFLESHNIISDNQYGFRKSRDTQLAALNLINYILPSLSEGQSYAGCVFLDFSKAFDTVSHIKLTQKLERYGIRGMALTLIKSYLTNRSQYVSINGMDSHQMPVEVGVPQGSCLGPLFYLIYSNDLNKLMTNINTVAFADDTTVIEICQSIETLTLKLNLVLSQVLDWSNYNKLALNGTKTKWMLFSNTSNIVAPDIFLAGIKLERVESFKFLGLFLDSNLKYKSHINYLRKKLSSFKYITYKLKLFLTQEAARKFYFGMIQSLLCYGILVWGGASSCVKAFDKLCSLQDKIVYNLFSKPTDTMNNINNIYKINNLLKIKDLYKVRVSMILYKIINENYAPFLLNEIMAYVNPSPYNTRQNNDFVEPFPRVNCVKINFLSNALRIWNELDDNIKSSGSVSRIKKLLTNKIINEY